jgi:hypothetical protein
MNAYVRSVSSETVPADANILEAHENPEGRDEAPIGLPEEGVSNRNDGLGEASPPPIAEREDRAGGARDANAETKKGVAKLIAFVWPPKVKAPQQLAGEGDESEGEGEGGERKKEEAQQGPDGEPANPALAEDDRPVMDDSQGRDGAAVEVAAKSQRPILKRKGALAVALAASVAIPAIVVLNWTRSAPQPVVEPGMLADGQTKVMAPSAALATTPPREAPNVSRDRPLVNETRRDELNEMLSFRGDDKAADGSTLKAKAAAMAPPGDTAQAPKAEPSATEVPAAEARGMAEPARAHSASETSAVPSVAPEAPLPAKAAKVAPALPLTPLSLVPSGPAKPVDVAQTSASHPATQSFVPRDHALSTAALPSEPGLGEAAKIEARLADLETAVKDRSNEARARLDAEKAETHTLEKIAELGALVTRLTGQVKDLEDRVQTLSTGADEKFADLTRRVALGEANRAVASAEKAESGGLAGQAQEKRSADGSEAQERTRTKVAAADVKHNYRIQAASPGLAMLTAVDGSPDDRPVEVAIGTELPGYGKVLSIEQHGQAWVVKANRGSIE